ncbi:Centromere/kinetochore protein zw10 [Pleurostoma richardsiae]|uniref:Centromere/kinetochore protein zw10 n=1 Tax=Pleurostoma richardsiae TaxID=41990 RepID=A0AA38RPI1_9PEZI|nr:Centromere/kinetochore protein zw10 [Pleurostoma richardsiae]
MAAETETNEAGAVIGQALVEFSVDGRFPEEQVSSLHLRPEQLPPAIQALADAKDRLKVEIHSINESTAGDVSSWMRNAKSLQDDITRSKSMANDILKQSEQPDTSGRAVRDAEEKVAFLQRELSYNYQVQQALKSIKGVNQLLDGVEQARDERRILDALRLLEEAWAALDAVPVSKSCRAMKLLDIRAFELKSDVHDVFDHVWHILVHVDADLRSISISESQQDEPMTLSDAVIGLKAYKEVDKRMMQLWHDIDAAVVAPRTSLEATSLPGVQVTNDTLHATGRTDKTIKSLFADLDTIFSFFAAKLPSDLVESMSAVMMPELMTRITSIWLDSAVPTSLKEMDEYQEVIAAAKAFCERLRKLKFSGYNDLQDWVDNAPRVWLSKCRETALDAVRTKLSEGLGASKEVERVERQMVSRKEGKQIAGASTATDNDDWGAAWDDDEAQMGPVTEPSDAEREKSTAINDDDGTDAWGWGEEDGGDDAPEAKESEGAEDDDGEAWGWGDADVKGEDETQPQAAAAELQTREMILKETYNISSMPGPVLQLISSILEDGAALTQTGYDSSPVAAAAAGLFNLPTLALAMFRAVSPYYYSLSEGGNMFLYNDATYIAEQLSSFSAAWKARPDLTPRAQTMLRLDNDIKSLQSFATRAYSSEMNIQKTILRDLLGGEQSLLAQDDLEGSVGTAVARVRSVALTWERILARSAWYQAVGSLVEALAGKVIADVMDAPSISQDEAYSIAKLIAAVTELDDLFLPSRAAAAEPQADEIPTTAQYAASWLRLKYLSEVLQSNLRDVRYLWMESELSLYFSKDEVVELINLSFEDNPRTREVVREISHNPHPVRGG